MQEYTISLPDDVAERLRRYGDQLRQRPEEVISELIAQDDPDSVSGDVTTDGGTANPARVMLSAPSTLAMCQSASIL